VRIDEALRFPFTHGLRRTFIMDATDAKLVLHEETRIEEGLIPVRECISNFNSEGTFLPTPRKVSTAFSMATPNQCLLKNAFILDCLDIFI
jgi:hypothetical protein